MTGLRSSFLVTTALCLITGGTLAGGAMAADLGAVDQPIRLAINEWTGQHITTHIAGRMLEAAGYRVEYVTAGYQNMWDAMAEGDLTAAVEVWASNVPESFNTLRDAGKVEDIGALGLEAREGVVYPAHVAELCPGLPDWTALKDCAALFATPETLPAGRLVDYPGEWGTPGADRITALGLPLKAVPAGSEGALIAEIRAAQERKTPLIAVFWQPHWAMSAYDLTFVALPDGTEACYDDPAAGPNPDVTGDCDFRPTRVFKAAWPGLKDTWPAAHQILSALQLTTEAQQPMMGAVDVEGKDVVAVTDAWMQANEAVWRPIVDAAVQ